MTHGEGRLVWDLPVRICHWLLLASVLGCWITHQLGPSWFDWHMRLGCTVLVLAAFRVLWGFLGTRHARFSNFVRGPASVLAYAQALRYRQAPQATVGHNPFGAISIVALLCALAFQSVTGLFGNDDIDNTGPLSGWVGDSTSHLLTTLHRQAFLAIEILVALHVVAVLWHLARGHDLIRPMWTGRKPASEVPAGESIPGSKLPLALVLLLVVVAVLLWVLHVAPPSDLY